MATVLNLTQHKATPEQRESGVVDLPEHIHSKVKTLLTFDELPDSTTLKARAIKIAWISSDKFPPRSKIMIGGAPYFMSYLENELRKYDLVPVYAFSKRESVEVMEKDGSVKKVNIFRHLGFVGE